MNRSLKKIIERVISGLIIAAIVFYFTSYLDWISEAFYPRFLTIPLVFAVVLFLLIRVIRLSIRWGWVYKTQQIVKGIRIGKLFLNWLLRVLIVGILLWLLIWMTVLTWQIIQVRSIANQLTHNQKHFLIENYTNSLIKYYEDYTANLSKSGKSETEVFDGLSKLDQSAIRYLNTKWQSLILERFTATIKPEYIEYESVLTIIAKETLINLKLIEDIKHFGQFSITADDKLTERGWRVAEYVISIDPILNSRNIKLPDFPKN